MSAQNSGGPAFPALEVQGGTDGIGCKDGIWHYPGMTLRDYFAAKVMQGMLTRPGPVDLKLDAEHAYLMADAMLAARSMTMRGSSAICRAR